MAPAGEYSSVITELCERALVTVIAHAGFWGRHLYLVGGLVPRYLVGAESAGRGHVGSHDVDLAVVLAIDPEAAESYETLYRNLRDAGFEQAPLAGDPDFRWRRTVEGQGLILEFLGETDEVAPGRSFRPKSHAGSGFQAFNVPGVRLLPADHKLVEIEAERLGGGRVTVTARVAGVAAFTTLKIRAYADRGKGKDVYDLVYVLLNHEGGPQGAGREMASSAVAGDAFVLESLALLRARFADPRNDAPFDYAAFLAPPGDAEASARVANEAVEAVRIALEAFDRRRGDAA
jgi:hypothetical protein